MRPRLTLSFGNFFSSAHFFLIVYILAPYLATFMPEDETGLVISLGAIVTLVAFPWMPVLVRKYGPRKIALTLAIIEGLVLAWLSFNPSIVSVIALVAIACAISPLIGYQLDLLLEATIRLEGTTGRIRSAFLTAGNAALIIAPLVVGLLLDSSDEYWRVFLVAGVSLVPFILLLILKKVPEGIPPTLAHLKATCSHIWADSDLRAVAIANATLQFFYHLAPLYIPLYLHNVLGLPWSELGWVFAVMLVPFVVLEYPAGWLADRKFGDKELMVLGFVFMGASFGAITFITASTSLSILLLILVMTRVGAALVEAMAEGHFFRRVSERDANTISVFRMTRPIAALAAPIVGSVILALSIGSYGILFMTTGIAVILMGVVSALSIKDIR